MDTPLRNSLWNVFQRVVLDDMDGHSWISDSDFQWLFKAIWSDFFGETLDTLGDGWSIARSKIRKLYFDAEWYKAYNFVEFIAQALPGAGRRLFIYECNQCLDRELSAYRFVGDKIAEITSETEIAAVETALADTSPLSGVNQHLQEALAKFADRKNPDYRNSIKESISAVEALARLITDNPKATLGEAIKRVSEQGVRLHPSQVVAWDKMYGYTSDEGGIRHAMSEVSDIRPCDAKYMLVTCSGFVSYLLDLCREAGLDLGGKA